MDKALLQMALDALEEHQYARTDKALDMGLAAVNALQAAIAQPAAVQPLTEYKITAILDRERMKWATSPPSYEFALTFARAIEAAHNITFTLDGLQNLLSATAAQAEPVAIPPGLIAYLRSQVAVGVPGYTTLNDWADQPDTHTTPPSPPAAQAEPVAWQFQLTGDGSWHNFLDEKHRHNTVEDGRWPIRALYTHPPTDAAKPPPVAGDVQG